jgi:hypothetical protein
VLVEPSLQIIGHANVKHALWAVREDINEEALFHRNAAFPGRSAARSGALQTRDRNEL